MFKHFDKNDAINNVEKIYKLMYELNGAILEKKRLEKECQKAADNIDRIELQMYDCVLDIKRYVTDSNMYEYSE